MVESNDIIAAAGQDARFVLCAAVDRAAPFEPAERLPALLKEADVLVDFSAAAASVLFVEEAAKAGVPAVVGTTGFDEMQRVRLHELAERIPLLLAPNMSLGMNLLFHLAALAAAALPGFEAALSETHHSQKKDAPSGSALRIADAVRSARKDGKAVPCASLRVGDVVGEHTLTLAGPGERLELTHRAHSREVFARGALAAALWVRGRAPGLYSMMDVLGLPAA